MAAKSKRSKLGILVGGGPAPGINGVISSATIEGVKQGFEVVGFKDGFKWLSQGDATHRVSLGIDDVTGVNARGGSILGTSRTNPAKSAESMRNVLAIFRRLGVKALVTIGGDDTAFSASNVHRQAAGSIRVAHVPKTIDNDLPLPGSTPTFGFETARHLGTYVVRNLAEDAKTTSRWYLIISMGRAAGHLALGIGKSAAATLTIIPEEFRGRTVTVDEVCDIIIGSIIKRRADNSHYGIAVLAEGLIEAVGEKGLIEALPGGHLERYGKITRDEHGHMRLGEIEFGRLMKDLLTVRLEKLGLKLTLVDKDLGYELRCANPIPFDTEYTRNLGYGAVKFLGSPDSSRYGAVISFVDGRMVPLPFDKMLNPQTGRMQVRKVNVDGEAYECSRRYMIRLEHEDFRRPRQLAALAAVVGMKPAEFKQRFGYVAEG